MLLVLHLCFGRFDPQVTLAAWQEFESQQEAVREFVNKARSTMERDLNFSSPESLAVELDQARVRRVRLRSFCLEMFLYSSAFFIFQTGVAEAV